MRIMKPQFIHNWILLQQIISLQTQLLLRMHPEADGGGAIHM